MAVAVVSIIIPTYNRANLIGETLDSILKQTYTNWECIVVDDGGTDATEEMMNDYVNRDSRIHYHHRPHKHLPGGNGARNYGLSLAKGDYVIFFDSDDLMTEDHIEAKLNAIQVNQVDYVIAKTKYFNSEISLESYYSFDEYAVSIENYLFEKINWLTYDTLIRMHLAKQLSFNEHLKSGQEFNFHCKLIVKSTSYNFIDKYLTDRRKHDNSIRSHLKSKEQRLADTFYKKFYTYQDIYTQLPKKLRRAFLLVCIDRALKSNQIFRNNIYELTKFTYQEIGAKAIYIPLIYMSKRVFKSPYRLRARLKIHLEK